MASKPCTCAACRELERWHDLETAARRTEEIAYAANDFAEAARASGIRRRLLARAGEALERCSTQEARP